jgi:organic hydroperoxide reductase OsmC/OhrA
VHPYPHNYTASATGAVSGPVLVASPQLPELGTAAPPQFGGPDGTWSPETLLCASLADCFVLTFRALSRGAHLSWVRLECRVEGVLDRIEGVAQFTRFSTFAALTIPAEADADRARRLLEQAEHNCLISNSLRAERVLEARLIVENPARTAVARDVAMQPNTDTRAGVSAPAGSAGPGPAPPATVPPP